MGCSGELLKGETSMTLKTVASGTTCQGMPLSDDANGNKRCWEGYVKWHEEGIMSGFFEGSYDSSSTTHPAQLRFFEQMHAQSEISKMLYTTDTLEQNIRAKVPQLEML